MSTDRITLISISVLVYRFVVGRILKLANEETKQNDARQYAARSVK